MNKDDELTIKEWVIVILGAIGLTAVWCSVILVLVSVLIHKGN